MAGKRLVWENMSNVDIIILQMLANGRSIKEASRAVGKDNSYASIRIKNLRKAFGQLSAIELVADAMRTGIIE